MDYYTAASGRKINFTEDESLFRELESSLSCLSNMYYEDIAEALRACSKYNILTKARAMDGLRKAGVIPKSKGSQQSRTSMNG